MKFSFKKKKSLGRSLSKSLSKRFSSKSKKAPKPARTSTPTSTPRPAPRPAPVPSPKPTPKAEAVEPEKPAANEEETTPREASPEPDLVAEGEVVEAVQADEPAAAEEEVPSKKEGEEAPAEEDEAASAKEKDVVQEEEGSKEEEGGEEEAAPAQEEEEEAAPVEEEEEEAEAQVGEEKKNEEEVAGAGEEEEETPESRDIEEEETPESRDIEEATEDSSPFKAPVPLEGTKKESVSDVVSEPSIETVEQEDGVLLGWFQPLSKEEEGEQERGLLDSGMHSLQTMIDGAVAQTMELGAQGMDLLSCGNACDAADTNEPNDAIQTSPEERGLDATPKDDETLDETLDVTLDVTLDETLDETVDGTLDETLETAADGEAKPADDDTAREDSYFIHPTMLKKVNDFLDQAKSTIESSYSAAEVNKQDYLGKANAKTSMGEASDTNLDMDPAAGDDSRNDSEEADPTFSTEEMRQEVVA